MRPKRKILARVKVALLGRGEDGDEALKQLDEALMAEVACLSVAPRGTSDSKSIEVLKRSSIRMAPLLHISARPCLPPAWIRGSTPPKRAVDSSSIPTKAKI